MLELLLLTTLILLSGFFSGSEVALVSIRESKVKTLLREKRKGAGSLDRLKKKPKKMLITILIGNNIVNIAASSMVAVLITQRFGSIGFGIATGIMTIVILIAGEIIPKTFASSHVTKTALLVSKPIELLSIILYPIVLLLDKFAILVNDLIKVRQSDKYNESEVMSVLDIAYEQNVLDKNIKGIMEKSIKFGKISIGEIMIPLEQVFVLDSTLTIKDSVDKIIENGFSRIPVYKNNRENIIGVILIKDILREIKNGNNELKLYKLAVEPPLISPLTHADNLLNFFQKKHIHFGLVKGGHKIIGIVTIEDLLEEIVGEITDESDVTPLNIKIINNNQIIVHPQTQIAKIEDFFKIDSLKEFRDTTAIDLFKKNVEHADFNSKFTLNKIEFRIKDIDKNKRVKLILITNKTMEDYLTEAIRKIIPQKNLIKFHSR